ncbi:MAG: hypothetical protein QW404_01350 [Candidatus Nanoarchaeia archaeon]
MGEVENLENKDKMKAQRHKKGMETVVAWVLILGFTITLGTLVFVWATRSTEKMTEQTLKSIEGGMQCEQVQIDANLSGIDDNCGHVDIRNKGYFTVVQIIIRGTKGDGTPITKQVVDLSSLPIKPKEEVTNMITSQWGINAGAKIDLIPVIREKNTLISCPERLRTVTCE